MESTEKQLLNDIILGYREVIDQRYQYDKINAKFDLPKSFDENRVVLFRKFFLEYIYPHPETRKELDEAFDQLDNYTKQPEKLLRLLADSASLIFKFGRHLPKILKSGLSALRSFRTAVQFERKLVQNAQKLNLSGPFDPNKIDQIIGQLSKAELDEFIENSRLLFEILHDRVLVQKIKEIVGQLIAKMKKRPEVYSSVEVNGLEIGEEIITKGDLLFDQLNKDEQQRIFEVVLEIERKALEDVFNK